jgi:peptidoglycan/xylan/chitin deacetylase (PgdA/CDA1 family)
MGTMFAKGGRSTKFLGLLAAALSALLGGALAMEPDRRGPPPVISGTSPVQAAEAEKPPLLFDRERAEKPATVGAVAAAEAEKPPLVPAPRTVDMPILVYHHVVPGHASGSEMTRVLFVTPETFEDQLKYLKDNGYQSVSFDDLADYLQYGIPLPDRPVILSFDDGWENQFTYAFPLLQKYGFTGTFYVVTEYLDRQNFMSVAELKTMIAAGMTIGCHSRSHPALTGLGSTGLQNEIAGSKAWLEQRLGVPVDTFAYPYGAYNSTVVAATKAAGFRTARTVDDGYHYTPDSLEVLDAVIYQHFVRDYHDKVQFASGSPVATPR